MQSGRVDDALPSANKIVGLAVLFASTAVGYYYTSCASKQSAPRTKNIREVEDETSAKSPVNNSNE